MMVRKAQKISFLWIVFWLFIGSASGASPNIDLEEMQAALQESKTKQAEISAERKKNEAELADIQKKLVELASVARRAETDWSTSQDKLDILNKQMKQKNEELSAKRKNLSKLTQAALHLSQMPPEAMLMEPGNADAIKVSRALKMTSDGIREEMESIRLQTAELKRLQQKVAQRRVDFEDKQTTLDDERESLQHAQAEKKALQQKLGSEQEEEMRRAERLAKQAVDLQALVDTANRRSTKVGDKSFAAAKGKLHMPVSGSLMQRFGAARGHDNTKKGVIFMASAVDAQVVAPFDGEVVFAGQFLNYGKLIILKHSDDFHTLLAGVETIDVRVGDFLLEGEPIGAMGEDDSARRLYFELRKNNQPVNPEPWIKELNKKH